LSTFDRDPYDYRCTSVESLQELMDKIDEKTFIKKLKEHVQVKGITNHQYDLLYEIVEACMDNPPKKK